MAPTDRPTQERTRMAPARRRRVARIVATVRQALEREPLLRHLPGAAELAGLLNVSLREARYALAELERDGWVRSGRHGYRALDRPPALGLIRAVSFLRQTQVGVDPFDAHLTLGIDRRCRELRLAFHAAYFDRGELDDTLAGLVRELPGHDVGWLMTDYPSHELARQWVDAGRRLVLIESVHRQMSLPNVQLDLAGALKLACDRLTSAGHRRVASGRIDSPLVQEAISHMAFPFTKGWPLEVLTGRAEQMIEPIRQWVLRWRRAEETVRPTAIVAHNALLATVLLETCRLLDVQVPGQLSLVGVGCEFGPSSAEANLTAVESPAGGRRAAGPGARITFASSGRAADLGRAAVDLLAQRDVMVRRPTVSLAATLSGPDLTVAPPPRSSRRKR